MKKLWARIGVELHLTDEELKMLLNEDNKAEEIFPRVLREKRFCFVGDSYVPDVCLEEASHEYGVLLDKQVSEMYVAADLNEIRPETHLAVFAGKVKAKVSEALRNLLCFVERC